MRDAALWALVAPLLAARAVAARWRGALPSACASSRAPAPPLDWVFVRKCGPRSRRNWLMPHTDRNAFNLNVALGDAPAGGGLFVVRGAVGGEVDFKWTLADESGAVPHVAALRRANASDVLFPAQRGGRVVAHNSSVGTASRRSRRAPSSRCCSSTACPTTRATPTRPRRPARPIARTRCSPTRSRGAAPLRGGLADARARPRPSAARWARSRRCCGPRPSSATRPRSTCAPRRGCGVGVERARGARDLKRVLRFPPRVLRAWAQPGRRARAARRSAGSKASRAKRARHRARARLEARAPRVGGLCAACTHPRVGARHARPGRRGASMPRVPRHPAQGSPLRRRERARLVHAVRVAQPEPAVERAPVLPEQAVLLLEPPHVDRRQREPVLLREAEVVDLGRPPLRPLPAFARVDRAHVERMLERAQRALRRSSVAATALCAAVARSFTDVPLAVRTSASRCVACRSRAPPSSAARDGHRAARDHVARVARGEIFERVREMPHPRTAVTHRAGHLHPRRASARALERTLVA